MRGQVKRHWSCLPAYCMMQTCNLLATAEFFVQTHLESEKNPNTPVLGLSSYGHSAKSVQSASVLISTTFPPVYTWHTNNFVILSPKLIISVTMWTSDGNKFKIRVYYNRQKVQQHVHFMVQPHMLCMGGSLLLIGLKIHLYATASLTANDCDS